MEKRYWVGIVNPFDLNSGTYEIKKSDKSHVIDSVFENIKTLNDIRENLSLLKSKIRSPTSCYFNIDEKSGIFYHDQQGCVLWLLKKDGKVYTDENLLVADSLPEFLSHIFSESREFYQMTSIYTGVDY